MAGSTDPHDEKMAARFAAGFFEKFDRTEIQEVLALSSTHWLLSNDDFKVPTEPPLGLISRMATISGNAAFFLMPVEDGIEQLDLREIHQIIRDLTDGIYILNQLPSCALEANFDQSTSCQIPPAYIDTKVGQLMINVDYMMKALWHGAYFPREKRMKFSERWRGNLDVNAAGLPETKKPISTEFSSAGMLDITKDPDFAHAYDKLPAEQPGDTDSSDDRRFFMSHADDLSMVMTLFQNTVQQHQNLFLMDTDWTINSVVRQTDDVLSAEGYERIQSKLLLQEMMLKENLTKKAEVWRQLFLLKVVSFLVPFLVAMKKRMKIPDISRLLPTYTGDEMKTERELPPLILGNDFKCRNFSFANHYFHLHGGIQLDNETCDPIVPAEYIQASYDRVRSETTKFVDKWLDPSSPLRESYPVPVLEINDKKYFAFKLDFETYYSQTPQKPQWVLAMNEEVSKLKPKKLPIPESQIYDLFKRYFGTKKAMKINRDLPSKLKGAAMRGLVALFQTLCRKCQPSRLNKADDYGLSVVHYAAMYNRPQIIAILILQSMDINVKKLNMYLSSGIGDPRMTKIGPTPLHLAARCGSLDAVSCLLANYANILATDSDGFAPIHHAAFYNHDSVIKLLIRKNEALTELQTKNDLRSTPLLLAAGAGALSALKCLINLGAYVQRKDEEGNNVVHLAAMRFHTNILEFFIHWNHSDVQVWTLLVEMLGEEKVTKKDAAVKCLEVMSTSDNDHWRSILEAGGVKALVKLLQDGNEDVQCVTASVLCNMSEHDEVRRALTDAKAAPILIRLLSSAVDDIQSRAAIVLSDLASLDDNKNLIASEGGIEALVNLLDSELVDVLVNAVNGIRVLCTNHKENQTAVARHGGIDPLVEFLTLDDDKLQAVSSAAIAALTWKHLENQDAVVQEGAVEPIVKLIRGRNIPVQVKAASALESLADKNADSQKAFLALDAPKALMKLLKIWSMEVKEQGACALWALAGQVNTRQKFIAERIGIPQLIDMLLLSSDKLQYVGCMGMTALCREDMDNQNRIAEQNGVQPLVRLLRNQKTSAKVRLTVIKVLGTICVGVAHKNNKMTQRKIAEENAIVNLVELLTSTPDGDKELQVEVAYTLACVVLSNPSNQEKLKEEQHFKFEILLDLLDSRDNEIRLKAGLALAIFAFNNTPQQYCIREAGGLSYGSLQHFLRSDNVYHQCSAAFQVVVLARVITDKNQVDLTAKGVTTLVNVINSDDDNAVVLAASFMSSLAHTRAGIPDAMISVGAIELLIVRLSSNNEQVRFACAVALGYLTFNRTAGRFLLNACRNAPGLYEMLTRNIGKNPKISRDFTEEFKRQKVIGLPCLSLEKNGGPPAVPPSRRGSRPLTSFSMHAKKGKNVTYGSRAMSAPAMIHRARSAPHVRLKPPTPDSTITRLSDDNSTLKSSLKRSNKAESYSFLKSQLSAWEK